MIGRFEEKDSNSPGGSAMPVITISRTLESEGETIGEALADRLKYRFFGREELEKIARDRRYSRSEVDIMDEKSFPLWDVLFRDKPKAYLSFVHDTICDAADEGNIVILGRGGQAILRDLVTAFHIRVDAPLEVRIRRAMERYGESEGRARKRVKEADLERKRFVRQAFGIEWSDPAHYHLVVNTGKMNVPMATDYIFHGFIHIPWAGEETEAKDARKRYNLVRAIRNELIRHPGIRCPSWIDVRCDAQGLVTLTGYAPEPIDRDLVEITVRNVKGVERVINKLRA
jgi:cytidylate kinase